MLTILALAYLHAIVDENIALHIVAVVVANADNNIGSLKLLQAGSNQLSAGLIAEFGREHGQKHMVLQMVLQIVKTVKHSTRETVGNSQFLVIGSSLFNHCLHQVLDPFPKYTCTLCLIYLESIHDI